MPPQRRGRGVDFEQRYKASKWAEDILLEAFLRKPFIATRLGISGVDPENLIRSVAGEPKVPDLLVFALEDLTEAEQAELRARKYDLRQVTSEEFNEELAFVYEKARFAVEVEFSPYKAAEMRQRHYVRKTIEQLDRRPLKHAKAPTAPNIFVKELDLDPLSAWQATTGVPVVVIHVFDQECFGVSLDEILSFRTCLENCPEDLVRLCHLNGIFRESQRYERVDAQGAVETKIVYKVTPAASRLAGEVLDVSVEAVLGMSKSKKYVSQVRFSGGRICFEKSFISWLLMLER